MNYEQLLGEAKRTQDLAMKKLAVKSQSPRSNCSVSSSPTTNSSLSSPTNADVHPIATPAPAPKPKHKNYRMVMEEAAKKQGTLQTEKSKPSSSDVQEEQKQPTGVQRLHGGNKQMTKPQKQNDSTLTEPPSAVESKTRKDPKVEKSTAVAVEARRATGPVPPRSQKTTSTKAPKSVSPVNKASGSKDGVARRSPASETSATNKREEAHSLAPGGNPRSVQAPTTTSRPHALNATKDTVKPAEYRPGPTSSRAAAKLAAIEARKERLARLAEKMKAASVSPPRVRVPLQRTNGPLKDGYQADSKKFNDRWAREEKMRKRAELEKKWEKRRELEKQEEMERKKELEKKKQLEKTKQLEKKDEKMQATTETVDARHRAQGVVRRATRDSSELRYKRLPEDNGRRMTDRRLLHEIGYLEAQYR